MIMDDGKNIYLDTYRRRCKKTGDSGGFGIKRNAGQWEREEDTFRYV